MRRKLTISDSYYAEPDAAGELASGEVYHIVRNRVGSGSVATPIARFFLSRPQIGLEGFHPYTRLDCFVRQHELSPPRQWLGQNLANALLTIGALTEPAWISWHSSKEIGGEPRGEVFDPE